MISAERTASLHIRPRLGLPYGRTNAFRIFWSQWVAQGLGEIPPAHTAAQHTIASAKDNPSQGGAPIFFASPFRGFPGKDLKLSGPVFLGMASRPESGLGTGLRGCRQLGGLGADGFRGFIDGTVPEHREQDVAAAPG